MAFELLSIPSRATDASGKPYSGAKWFFYQSGTTTPLTVYADSGLTTPLTNPVVSDASGLFVPVYFDLTYSYRGVLTDSTEAVTIFDIDPINVSGANSFTFIPDGDKGDIKVSNGGITWTIDDNVVTFSKMQTIATKTVLGRSSGGTGQVEQLTLGAGLDITGGALVSTGGVSDGDKGDVTVSSSGTTWTIDNTAVSFAKMQDIATNTLVGRYTAGTGAPQSITIGSGLSLSVGGTLTASGGGGGVTDGDKGDVTVTGSGSVWTIDNTAVTYAKIQNVTSGRLLGRSTAGAGVTEEITIGTGLSLSGGVLSNTGGGGGGGISDGDKGDISVTGSGTVWTIDSGAVDLSKMANMSSYTFIGRTATSGVPAAISYSLTGYQVMNASNANAARTAISAASNNTNSDISEIIGLSNGTGTGPSIRFSGNVDGIYRPANGTIAMINTFSSSNYQTFRVTATDLAAGNVYLGAAAGQASNTANSSVYIGNSAGSSLGVSGSRNTVVGASAATSFVSSTGDNVFVGALAGYSLTGTGGGNTIVGSQAASLNSGNLSNATVIGYNAGKNVSGISNTFVGTSAALNMTTGANSVAIGSAAMLNYTTADQNVAIGAGADSTGTNGGNNVTIGYSASKSTNTSSNQFTLGNSSIATLRCQVTTITALSDRRDKKDIVDFENGLKFINSLTPRKFTWNMRDGGKVDVKDVGFIAQEVDEVEKLLGIEIPNLVHRDNPDKLELGAGTLIPVLVSAIKELTKRVEELENGK